MISAALDQDVAGLQHRFRLLQHGNDLVLQNDCIVDGTGPVHARMDITAMRRIRIVEDFSE